jgi:hypothetical protein
MLCGVLQAVKNMSSNAGADKRRRRENRALGPAGRVGVAQKTACQSRLHASWNSAGARPTSVMKPDCKHT